MGGTSINDCEYLITEDSQSVTNGNFHDVAIIKDQLNLPPSEVSSQIRRGYPSSSQPKISLPRGEIRKQSYRGQINLYQGVYKGPIKFSPELAELLISFIYSHINEDMRFVIVPDYIIDIVGNELKRFMTALEAYRSTYDFEYMNIRELINGLKDPAYASYLKKVRTKSFLISDRLEPMEEPDWWNEIPHYKIYDIGQIFNYNYWFRWEEPEPEDYLEAWAYPISRIDPDELKKFKDILRNILPTSVEQVFEEEVLLENSGSSCFDPKSKNLRSKVYKNKEDSNYFSNEPLYGIRTPIYVSPDNYRDAIILSVPQSNSVKLIEKQVRLIAEETDGSAYFRNTERFNHKLEQFREDYTYFLDRDLVKEGITKPRELIWAMFDVFEELYPGFSFLKYRGIYNNYFLKVGNDWKEVPRGHGLGMANALTTIMQAACVQMVFDRMEENDFTVGQMDCLAYNDDLTIGFTDQYDMETYWDVEDSVLSALQLVRKPSKSHKGRNNVLCEIYHPLMNSKRSYTVTEVYQIFAAPVIGMAKNLSKAFSPWVSRGDIELYLVDIRNFWGYEFYPGEWKYPATFGGWISPEFKGIRLDMYVVSRYPLDYSIVQAFNACAEPIKKSKRGGRPYLSPFEKIYGSNFEFPKKFDAFIPMNKTIREIDSMFMKPKTKERLEHLILSYQARRLSVFRKKIDGFPMMSNVYEQLVNKYPLFDFLPPLEICQQEELIIGTDIREQRPSVANPLMSLLKFFNRDLINDHVLPYWRSVCNCVYERKSLTSEARDRLSQVGFLSGEDVPGTGLFIRNIENSCEFPIYDKNSWATATLQLYGIRKFLIPYKIDRELKINETQEDILIDTILRGNRAKLFKFLTQKIGFKRALLIVTDNESIKDLYSCWKERKSRFEQEKRDPEPPPKTEMERDNHMIPYLIWRDLSEEDKKRSIYYDVLEEIDSWFYHFNVYNSISIIGVHIPDPEETLSRRAKDYWSIQGGEIFLRPDGLKILYINGVFENPEEIDSEDEAAQAGMFGDGGDY
jgi:hypothetical protein